MQQGANVLGRYGYDAQGLRILKIGDEGRRQYTYDQLSVITEADQANLTVSKYDYGIDQLVRLDNNSEGRSFFHLDILGSTANLTDGAAATRQSILYDAWGSERDRFGTSANNFTFTGHENDDETGLIYAKARFYDPDIGRFLTQDRFPHRADVPPSLHRYLYVHGSPTYYIDPLGLYEWDVSLGGPKSDDDLKADLAEARNKKDRERIDNILTMRNQFRQSLRDAKLAYLALPNADDEGAVYARRARRNDSRMLARAVEEYYLSEGENPLPVEIQGSGAPIVILRGAVIVAEKTAGGNPGETRWVAATREQRYVVDPGSGGVTVDLRVRVTIDPDEFADEDDLPVIIAHEGSHLADHYDIANAVVRQHSYGGTTAMGDPTVDVTQYESEVRAFRVSASMAESQYRAREEAELRKKMRQTSTVTSFPLGLVKRDDEYELKAGRRKYKIWDADWNDDRARQRDIAIDEFLADPDSGYGLSQDAPGIRLSGERPRPR